MLPMNVDLIDTLIFERQHEIRRQFQRLAVSEARPHPLLTRLWAALTGRVARPVPTGAPAVPAVVSVTIDRPSGVVLLPTTTDNESLDRAA